MSRWRAWPWRKWALEAAIVATIVGAVTLWQNRGLPEGLAPPLSGLRTDGTFANVGAGPTAQLVVFWATWCGVCRAEAGNIENVARDWSVVSVAMQSGDRDEIARYLAQKKLALPAIEDDDGDLSIAWKVRVVPAHFVLDPAGNIRFRVVGYATEWGLRARLWWAQNFPV